MAQEKKQIPGTFGVVRRVAAVFIAYLLIALVSAAFRIILAPLAISPTHIAPEPYIRGVSNSLPVWMLGPLTTIPEPSIPAPDLSPARLSARWGAIPNSPPPDRQQMLRELSRIFGGIPFASTAFGALARFTPILLALYLLRQDPNEEIQRLLSFSRFLVLVHFGILSLYALNSLLATPWFTGTENFIMAVFSRDLGVDVRGFSLTFFLGGRSLGVAILGVLLPLIIWNWRRRFQPEDEAKGPPDQEDHPYADKAGQDRTPRQETSPVVRDRWVNVIFLLIIGLCIALSVSMIINSNLDISGCGEEFIRVVDVQPLDLPQLFRPDLMVLTQAVNCARPVWGWIILLGGSILALLARWLMGRGTRALGQTFPSIWLWVSALLLLGIHVGELPTLWISKFDESTVLNQGRLWFALAVVLGWALTFSLAWTAYHGLRWLMQWRQRLSTQALWLAAGILIVFSIPTLGLVDRDRALGRTTDLYQLAYRLDDLLIFLWTAAVIYVLYLDGKEKGDLSIGHSSRHLAMLATGVFLFGLNDQFLYIPVTFLLGYALLVWATDLPSLPRQPKRNPEQLREWIRTFSLVRLSEQLYGGIRRENTKKLSKGESKLSDFLTAMEEYEATKAEKEADLPTRKDGSRINPLAFGPRTEAWSNGIHGLTWSLIFALPWIIIYLFSFLAETEFNRLFPLLSFLKDILTLVSFWAGIGFVMGYFFPSLRGSSGLQKGLILGLVLIVARMPLSLAYNREFVEWQATLLLSMQVFIQCLLLGLLAFDFYVLKKWHFSFQQLLEIHGLSGLGIWLSSLIVAIGAVITPLLASDKTAGGLLNLLVTAVGKILGVDLGDVVVTP